MNYQPESIDAHGRITARDENGVRHIYHTDSKESQQYFHLVQSLSQGVEELGLLLHATKTPEWAEKRYRDGRTDDQLRADWLRKVCSTGLRREIAERWLTERVVLEKN